MKKLTVLSVAHFCVDMACAALFFGRLDRSAHWWLYMVLYNACAFALQLPPGAGLNVSGLFCVRPRQPAKVQVTPVRS